MLSFVRNLPILLTVAAICGASPRVWAAPAVTAVAVYKAQTAVGSYGSVRCGSIYGKVGLTLKGCSGAVDSLAYSADGTMLAAGGGLAGRSGEVIVWSVPSGRILARLTGPVDLVQSIAWRPGKPELAGASYDKNVYLWSVPSRASTTPVHPYRILRDHTDAVYCAAFSPNGALLASASGDRTLKIWDVQTGKRLLTLGESTAELYAAAFTPDGKAVAGAGVDRVIRVWNPVTGDLLKSAFAHDGPILSLAYLHSGASLISAGEDRAVKVWKASDLTEQHVFPRQPEWPQAIALSEDDAFVTVGCRNGSVSRYALDQGRVDDALPAGRQVPSLTGAKRIRNAGLSLAANARRSPSGSRLTANVEDSRASLDPEIKSAAGNFTVGGAQPVPTPAVIDGELWDGSASAAGVSRYYQFQAKKGEPLVIDTMARRAGSPLDSFIQILTASGEPVERAVLRARGQSEITLFDKDSSITGIRLLPFPDLHLNDYVLIGRELLRVAALPKGPDDDTQFRSIHGQRVGYLGTNPEYHSIGTKVYRVDIHPAGSKFSPNGMPLTHVMYENDDGGPLYGRDSYLMFDPPADGRYIARVTDSRGQQGKGYTYKLEIHPPRPDYKISFSPATVTVPKGGREAVTVECDRYEGFDGPVHVKLEGLPQGFTATETQIEAGETGAVLLVSASADAVGSTAKTPLSFRVASSAQIGGVQVHRDLPADPTARKLVIGGAPGVSPSTDVQEITLRPGGEAAAVVSIIRSKGFSGRVPIDIRNLPFGVKVMDVGLNGILVTEQQTSRRIVLSCEPWVTAQDRVICLMAGVEGGIGTGSAPITLHIHP